MKILNAKINFKISKYVSEIKNKSCHLKIKILWLIRIHLGKAENIYIE